MARPRRATRLAGWLLVLAAASGGVLAVDRWTGVAVADWLAVLATMVFAVSLAAMVIAGLMAFVIWWFFTRSPR